MNHRLRLGVRHRAKHRVGEGQGAECTLPPCVLVLGPGPRNGEPSAAHAKRSDLAVHCSCSTALYQHRWAEHAPSSVVHAEQLSADRVA